MNWKAGKTELMAFFSGTGLRKARGECAALAATGLPVPSLSVSLCLTRTYKHLGSGPSNLFGTRTGTPMPPAATSSRGAEAHGFP
eukprot:5532762-Pyramimonas_sp.AAC.1